MRIYVVALERSVERRAAIRTQLDSTGLDYEFFPAVDGKAGEHLSFANYRDEFCLKVWRRPLTSGEVGCFASHYLLWQRCVERDEPMIVMEDDVVVSPRFAEAVALVVAERPGNVGYVRFAGINLPAFRETGHELPDDWELVRFFGGPMGTQCYVVFPQAASRFLAHARKWVMPVDTYMDSFWQHGVAAIGILPFPVERQLEFGSEIWESGGSRAMSTRDQVSRLRRVAVILRDRGLRRLHNLKYRLSEWTRLP
jgi:glycosyl transferase, family 25